MASLLFSICNIFFYILFIIQCVEGLEVGGRGSKRIAMMKIQRNKVPLLFSFSHFLFGCRAKDRFFSLFLRLCRKSSQIFTFDMSLERY